MLEGTPTWQSYGRAGRPRGLFVGLTTVDLLFSFDEFPQEDTKNTAKRYMAAAGGPASNAAVAFSYLGGAAALVSSLGTSGVADVAKRDLTTHRVQHIDLTPDRTSDPAVSAIAIAEDSGSRTILTSPAIADDLEASGDVGKWDQLVEDADVVMLDGHQGNTGAEIARCAASHRKPVVLDGDLYTGGLEGILPMVDVAIVGKSFSLGGVTSTEDLLSYFGSHGVRHVAATCGPEPIQFTSGGSVDRLRVESGNAVDTLAAGDFFHGAFCHSWAKAPNFGEALVFARDVASRSVRSFGTRMWMHEADSAHEA